MKVILSIYSSLYLIAITTFVYPQGVSDNSSQLTIQEALSKAKANHPALQIQQTYLDQAMGQRQSIGVLPNPTVSYYRENLGFAGENFGEWIVDAELPLNFLWERWSETASANAKVKAQSLMLSNAQRLLEFEVRKAYVNYLFGQKMTAKWREVNAIFDSSIKAAEARYADGDISNYELQRIKMEQIHYLQAALEAESERLSVKRQLAFLIDPNNQQPDFDTVQDITIAIPAINADSLINASAISRPDLQAAEWLLQSHQSNLTAEKWKRLPEITLNYGYKEQTDNFSGSVFQLSVGLPLFNWNQGNIRQAQAEKNRQSLQFELLEEQVKSETILAFEQFRAYQQQYRQITQTDEQSLKLVLTAAVSSYQEGEMSLVELLDAVKAYLESFRTRYQFLTQYYISIFEMQKASGISITGL